MLRRILPVTPEQMQFLLVQADSGFIFARQAQDAPVGSELRQYYLRNAQHCLDTVMRFRTRVHLPMQDELRLEARLGPLVDLVNQISTAKPHMAADSRVLLLARGAQWVVKQGESTSAPYADREVAMAAAVRLAFEAKTDLLQQDERGAWQTVRSYRPIRGYGRLREGTSSHD
ncbi:MAG TPA: hypothetical protein VMF13_19740 [Luteitalea sp.]|nr:hypothetical protein [Luteitalea sp.]